MSYFFVFLVGKPSLITTTVSSTVKPLTIVTATAGALLLLLLIVISLVAYQRRRIAINNRRQGRERLNEDDRYSFVYYSNDVHVVLPSYDEAMRVQGAPPPYGNDATAGTATVTENVNNDQGRLGDVFFSFLIYLFLLTPKNIINYHYRVSRCCAVV